jgi:regulator of sirC expression with transglutaminase-like and TPR domain
MTPSHDDPAERLAALVAAPGPEIDIAEAALACAELDRPGLDLAPYRRHLAMLRAALGAGDPGAPPELLAALLADAQGYRGDRETYDDLANADLPQVIARRRGLPVALAILWIHAARGCGWRCHGLDMPAHFLVRLEAEGASWTLDPFAGGAVLGAQDFAALVARLGLDPAPRRAADLATLDDRAVLLRLQNNLRVRLQQSAGPPRRLLDILGRMLILAPGARDLWLEASALNERLENFGAALTCLDNALALVEDAASRQRVAARRARLASRLN